MQPPKTEAEALAQSILIWVDIAQKDTFEMEDKKIACEDLLGYTPLSFCPLCEFDHDYNREDDQCKKCPVVKWGESDKSGFSLLPCLDLNDSPYFRWTIGEDRAAWDMVELLSDNLQRLAKGENHD